MTDRHRDAIAKLAEALQGVGGASALYLVQAMEALDLDGAGGTLRIHIPTRQDKGQRLEVEWLGLQKDSNKMRE